jgi:serine protease Do
LVNVLGEVIGMNSSIFSPSGGSIGLGFAIPIKRVVRVADDLLAHGFIRRPWVGIKMELPASNNPRDLLGSGVVVSSVVPGSPAAQGGVKPGDIVRTAGGRDLRSPYDWEAVLLDLRVGDKLPLAIQRGGREITLNLTVEDLPEVSAPRVEVMQELELVTMTSAIRGERGVRTDHGALVVRASDSITSEIGLRAGDVIVQVNRQPIDQAEQVRQVLEAGQGRGAIRVYFERGGRVYITDFIVR